jgi:hypothetical protein
LALANHGQAVAKANKQAVQAESQSKHTASSENSLKNILLIYQLKIRPDAFCGS